MSDELGWVFIFLLLYWAFCLFWGVRVLRQGGTASDFFLAGRKLSPWVYALAATAISVAGWTILWHPALVLRDGFQYLNMSFFVVTVSLGGVVLLKRQWLLGRRFGYMTMGDMFVDYFDSNALNIISSGIAILFGVAFSGMLFSTSGELLHFITDGNVSRITAMWILSTIVLLYAILGGMQAVAKVSVVQFFLYTIGIITLGSYALGMVDGFDSLNQSLAKLAEIQQGTWGATRGYGGGDYSSYFAIPGVIQWTAGLNMELPTGGPWTVAMVFTFVLAITGIQASPTFTMLGFASRSTRGFAIQHVWLGACCVGILLFVFSALQGISVYAHRADNTISGQDGLLASGWLYGRQYEVAGLYIAQIMHNLPWLSGLLFVCAIAALQTTAAGFMFTAGSVVSRDLYVRYWRANADHSTQKSAGRLFIALVFLCAMLLATFSMELTYLLGGVAIACAFQLWPALLAVTWFPWITRRAATLGLIAGIVGMILTDVLGQKIFGERLPWGHWPWTIYSAVWGMLFNIIVCLIVAASSQNDSNRERRDKVHNFLKEYAPINLRRRWSSGGTWFMIIIWVFFAIGPGSLLGNYFFGEPGKGYSEWMIGVPSLWAWQIIWWALGVGIVWHLAYKLKMSTDSEDQVDINLREIGDIDH